jgi:hypothetical protein
MDRVGLESGAEAVSDVPMAPDRRARSTEVGERLRRRFDMTCLGLWAAGLLWVYGTNCEVRERIACSYGAFGWSAAEQSSAGCTRLGVPTHGVPPPN